MVWLALVFGLLGLTPIHLLSAGEGEERVPTGKRPIEPIEIRSARETDLSYRLHDLEQEVSRLGQEINYLKDRNRSLERQIDDLRSRHV